MAPFYGWRELKAIESLQVDSLLFTFKFTPNFCRLNFLLKTYAGIIVTYVRFCVCVLLYVCVICHQKTTFATKKLIPNLTHWLFYTNIAQLMTHTTILYIDACHAVMLSTFLAYCRR